MPGQILRSRLLALFVLGMMSLLPLYAGAQGETCTATINAPNGTISLRSGPGVMYTAINTFRTGDTVTVIGRIDNGWSALFEGFLPDGVLTFGSNCAGLPTLPASDFPPPGTATPVGLPGTPTPFGQLMPTIIPIDMTATPIPADQCLLTSSAPVQIFSQPDVNSQLIGVLILDRPYMVFVQDSSGWYEIYLDNIGLAWVRGEDVSIIGDCSQVPLPTPTMPGFEPNVTPFGDLFTATPIFNSITPIPTIAPPDDFYSNPSLCAVTNAFGVVFPLYNGPSDSYAVYAEMQPGQVYRGVTRADNGWIELATNDRISRLVGWVGPYSVNTNAACMEIPQISADTYDVTVWYPEY